MARGTAAFVATQLAQAMAPLADAVSSPGRFRAFMLRMGWQVEDVPPAYQQLGPAVDSLISGVDALGDDPSPSEIARLLDSLVGLFEAVDGLSSAPAGVDPQAFLEEFADRSFELLIVDYLALALPASRGAGSGVAGAASGDA